MESNLFIRFDHSNSKTMRQTSFKFYIQRTKFGAAKVKNIRAHSFDEAKQKLFSEMTHPKLTRIDLVNTEYAGNVMNFDFNYQSEFYKNYINTL